MYLSIENFMTILVDPIYSIRCSSGIPGTDEPIYQPRPMDLSELCYRITIQFRNGYIQDHWVVEFKTKKERNKVFTAMIDDLAAGKQVLRIPATACVR